MNPITSIEIDLLALAHAAVSETMGTGGPNGEFYNLFQTMLSPNKNLTWIGNGPGIGRELRRAYSNIHGRYFGRYYLQSHENVLGLIPIEGKNMSIGNKTFVRIRNGLKGDMPDWIGWTSTGFVVGEAKGAYGGGDWATSLTGWGAEITCLKKAGEQIARVQIDKYGRYGGLDLKHKGWAVASRWATEQDGLDPWLVAIDPESGETPVDESVFEEIATQMQREFVRRALISTGFNEGSISSQESDRSIEVPSANYLRVTTDEGFHFTGNIAIMGPMGFLPLRTSSEIATAIAIQDIVGPLLLVVVTKDLLDSVIENRLLRESERRQSNNYYLRNGVAVVVATSIRNFDFLTEQPLA